MHLSSSPSPEESGHASDPVLMHRRFVEALRRAEIIALINEADSVERLTASLAEELCEVFDAEIAFIVDCGQHGEPWRMLALVGTEELSLEATQRWGPVLEALTTERAAVAEGEDLADAGGRTALVASHRTVDGRAIVLGVIRLYESSFDPPERALLEAVTGGAGHALDRLWSHEDREALIARLRETMVGTATALANALEARDDYTAGHARDIAELAVAVGERLGISGAELDELRFGGIFHDIGKIAIPDGILRKPAPLTAEERALIERHTIVGAEILEPVQMMGTVPDLVRHSHERWDGRGYPDGLAGTKIPLGSRIIAVVDAWHAMVSQRPYQGPVSADAALAELEANAGTQFDPRVVETFVALMDERPQR